MKRFPRFEEYKVVGYRILLAYVFYTIARLLFFFYNRNLIQIDGVTDIVSMCYHGLTFDTASILYLNLLFIVFSILPLRINHSKKYQTFLFYLYFIPNLLGYATNFVDFIYYRFNFGRSTIAAFELLEHESNKSLLLINFLINYWHVFVLFFLVSYVWIYLYKKVSVQSESSHKGITYFGTSAVGFLVIATLIIGGINATSNVSNAWVYTRTGSTWTQQGTTIVGSDAIGTAANGTNVSLSADGNTAMMGSVSDNGNRGAAWVFTRSGNTYTQKGNKLVATGAVGTTLYMGRSVAISADGTNMLVGADGDATNKGASWSYAIGVTYDGNGNTSGTVPASSTLAACIHELVSRLASRKTTSVSYQESQSSPAMITTGFWIELLPRIKLRPSHFSTYSRATTPQSTSSFYRLTQKVASSRF